MLKPSSSPILSENSKIYYDTGYDVHFFFLQKLEDFFPLFLNIEA